jgi:hypothetical protein
MIDHALICAGIEGKIEPGSSSLSALFSFWRLLDPSANQVGLFFLTYLSP